MVKAIDCTKDRSLSGLDASSGCLVAFDNVDYKFPHPFIIALVDQLVPVTKVEGRPPKGIHLLYTPNDAQIGQEHWILVPQGRAIEFLGQKLAGNGSRVPDVHQIDYRRYTKDRAYVVERAYSGFKAVHHALRTHPDGLGFYAPLLESGKLIAELIPKSRLVFSSVLREQPFRTRT